jgi:glycosyltransferase involved in cell wall biosynthesis
MRDHMAAEEPVAVRDAHLPPLSVVVTVRNEVQNIGSLVDSLLAQSLRPAEVVIVDGQSTDGTLEVLKPYAEDGRIELISADCNIAEGRNLGIRRARHECVAVTDAGCRVDAGWLEAIARCFASAEAPDVVSGNFRFDVRSRFEQDLIYATYMGDREDSYVARYYPSSRSIAFRKTAWAAAGGYPEWLYAAEDTLFNIRLRQLGHRFAFCRDAIVRWRPRETWSQAWRQRYNYGRGNGRVGFGVRGYSTNIRYHLAMLLPLLLTPWTLLGPLVSLGVLAVHVRRHLWTQARRGWRETGSLATLLRVLALMEWVRLAGMAGFLRGRIDRWTDPQIALRQRDWMGVASVEDLPPDGL